MVGSVFPFVDGAEMLLDLGLPSALIGGIVLPLLGAVPDAAMIIASGVGKSREQANKEIAVGMGYLYMYISPSTTKDGHPCIQEVVHFLQLY